MPCGSHRRAKSRHTAAYHAKVNVMVNMLHLLCTNLSVFVILKERKMVFSFLERADKLTAQKAYSIII
jgi:hypothetical protein